MSGRFTKTHGGPTHRAYLVSLLLLASMLCGCNQAASVLPPPKADTVRIVSSFPRKGPLAHQSQQMVNAIDLVLRDAQARQPTSKIEHIALDDSDSETGDWSSARELDNARAAADDSTVVAYIGPYNTGATGVSLPVTSRAGLLQIGPTATWPGLTTVGGDPNEPEKYYGGLRNFVRLMPPYTREAQAAARWASDS